jgi:ureidoglycolate hydrolase
MVHHDNDLARKYNFCQKLEEQQVGSPMTLNLVKTEALASPYLYAGMEHHHHPVTSV